MNTFKRARSDEQKEQRMQQIKDVVIELFQTMPYQDITLTIIAEKLNLTRANLYSYASTKEEIFLEICADLRDEYYNALITALPCECGYSVEVLAEVWAGILNSHQEHLHYSDILSTIIETNVTVDRLAAFKKRYYENAYKVSDRIASIAGISKEAAYEILLNIHFHAIGIHSISRCNPLVAQALEQVNLSAPRIEFRTNIRDYMLMNLRSYIAKEKTE